jgi:hypothetical protein
MEKLITIILLVGGLVGNAQTIEREVVSSSGDFYSNGTGQLSTTFGEPVIVTFSNGTNELTQGFHQTRILITSIGDRQISFEMEVYPNPVAEFLTIKVDELKKKLSYSVFNIEAKMVLDNEIHSIETKIDLTQLAKGTYILKITENNTLVKSYKILKK